MDQPVDSIMNRQFTTGGLNDSNENILAMMKQRELRHIPVIDNHGRVVDLKILNEMILKPERSNWVILMAGGLGTRLQPLTNDCPKPLLKVGGKPILGIILENFVEYGFKKFYVSVNYKAEMIESFLGDGSRWHVQISYLNENEKLGTAGALGLLLDQPLQPLVVMNSDVLTKVNWQHLLDFHTSHKATATMCVRDYHFQFPYGVVSTDQHRLTGIDEKPIQRFFVNAGIYVFEPEVLNLVPRNAYLDMPDLFSELIAQGFETAVFPIREYWIDIGRMEDYERAHGEFHENFE
jgi:NDP-sugar pyrophosphorylase family protein